VEDLRRTNHAYSGISIIIDFLKKQGIDWHEYVDYVEEFDNVDTSKFEKQEEFKDLLTKKYETDWKHQHERKSEVYTKSSYIV
jgi:hypothetical protein